MAAVPEVPADDPVEPGSTPDDGAVPADDDPEAGSTPDEGDDDAGDDDADDDADEGDDEGDDDDEADADDDEAVEASAVETEDPEDDPSWKNLAKKFAHIKNPRDRRAQIAKAYWSKAKYDKQVRQENEALRRRIRELESGKPKDETKPGEPHPDLVKADARIESLKARDTEILKDIKVAVEAVNEADREVAIAKSKLEDLSPDDEDRASKERLIKSRIQERERELRSVTAEYKRLRQTKVESEEKLQQAQTDRDWIERFQADQANKAKSEQTTREQFDDEFPKMVDSLILKAAKRLGIDTKENKQLRRSLIRNVNRALILELGNHDVPLDKLDLRGMVQGFVREYAVDRDIVKRKNFTAASRNKLAVTRTGSQGDRRTPTSPVRPAGSSKPVPVSLMGGDSTSQMAVARQRLVNKFG
jgi:hypothetical protein